MILPQDSGLESAGGQFVIQPGPGESTGARAQERLSMGETPGQAFLAGARIEAK